MASAAQAQTFPREFQFGQPNQIVRLSHKLKSKDIEQAFEGQIGFAVTIIPTGVGQRCQFRQQHQLMRINEIAPRHNKFWITASIAPTGKELGTNQAVTVRGYLAGTDGEHKSPRANLVSVMR